MTTPPLPDGNTLRVRLIYGGEGSQEAGSRFYLHFAGTAPTPANCATLATDIANAWHTDMAPSISSLWGLIEVDVLDITTVSGNSGTAHVAFGGSGGTGIVPANCAVNVEFSIARRYRGGKPRMFWPPPDSGNLASDANWSTTFVANFNTAVTNFFTAVEALSVGAVGALTHVNLSYYHGFTNIANSSGRERAVPTYRATALTDTITGYNTKIEVGSQRRRRISTTP